MSGARLAVDSILAVGAAVAFATQMLRWLRVLQREHYEPSSMRLFLGRWSSPQVPSAKSVNSRRSTRPVTLSHVLVIALLVTVLLRADRIALLVAIVYGLACPVGLSIKGRTSTLQWTRRLTTICVVATLLGALIVVAGAFSSRPWLLVIAMIWAVPLLLDVSARILEPYEKRKAQGFVDKAVARLTRVAPRIVAITGSYGKTSTKNHLVDLLGGSEGVVASPRSFNNRAGLSRAINENLADGTKVFIAEMGTYGPGEISELCSWCPPEIAVITAIGPVHLERMKTVDVIEKAKFEITVRARTVVVNVDDVRLATWPDRLGTEGKKVRTAGSKNEEASVRVVEEGVEWVVWVDRAVTCRTPKISGVQPTNLACAVAAALELGLSTNDIADGLARVSSVANRANVVTAASGVIVIDDTFNANPASAASALSLLMSLDLTGRRVVVTPGLIELGRDQYGENLALARRIAALGAELAIVARTNALPLSKGYEKSAMRFDTRDEAVAWVRSTLVAGDGVLYLNDLPDHYP